jgi:hypothetical protein
MMSFHIKKVIYVFTYILSVFLCQRSVYKHAVCMYKTHNGSIHFAFRQVRRDRFQQELQPNFLAIAELHVLLASPSRHNSGILPFLRAGLMSL